MNPRVGRRAENAYITREEPKRLVGNAGCSRLHLGLGEGRATEQKIVEVVTGWDASIAITAGCSGKIKATSN
jgi:hypothetical protein